MKSGHAGTAIDRRLRGTNRALGISQNEGAFLGLIRSILYQPSRK